MRTMSLVLSLIESTTGMSQVIMTHRKGLTQHQLHQAKKWINHSTALATLSSSAMQKHPSSNSLSALHQSWVFSIECLHLIVINHKDE